MKILFMGTPDFAVPSLQALIEAGHEIVGVFTQPDKPKNRGMKLLPTPVKVVALEHDIPVFQPTKLRDGTALETIQGLVISVEGHAIQTASFDDADAAWAAFDAQYKAANP